jgi:hypothetical protein
MSLFLQPISNSANGKLDPPADGDFQLTLKDPFIAFQP